MGVVIFLLFYVGFIVFLIASIWKVFEKAGQPGWACLVPFYNIYIQLKIADKPGIWMLYLLIPFYNIYILFQIYIAIAKNFGKDTGFGIGLIFLGFIFFPILAFGDAVYKGGVEKPLSDHLVN